MNLQQIVAQKHQSPGGGNAFGKEYGYPLNDGKNTNSCDRSGACSIKRTNPTILWF